jgi:hypothetical protein
MTRRIANVKTNKDQIKKELRKLLESEESATILRQSESERKVASGVTP